MRNRSLNYLLISGVLVINTLTACSIFKGGKSQQQQNIINPEALWPDDRGEHIQAHGGGIIKWKSHYYWYGESRRQGLVSNRRYVSCYRSEDLVNWTNLGDALNITKPDDSLGQWVVERP
jgi:hypothetical protein